LFSFLGVFFCFCCQICSRFCKFPFFFHSFFSLPPYLCRCPSSNFALDDALWGREKMAAVPGCSTSVSLPLASLAKLHLLTSNTRQVCYLVVEFAEKS
jgi:hypothetical protein